MERKYKEIRPEILGKFFFGISLVAYIVLLGMSFLIGEKMNLILIISTVNMLVGFITLVVIDLYLFKK
jgi:hypothetical protein